MLVTAYVLLFGNQAQSAKPSACHKDPSQSLVRMRRFVGVSIASIVTSPDPTPLRGAGSGDETIASMELATTVVFEDLATIFKKRM